MFPSGLIVHFRFMAANNMLAGSIHTNGRGVGFHPQDRSLFEILDESGNPIAYYERDAVACILPLQTIGPAAHVDLPK